MPTIDISVQCPIHDSFRVRQIAGMFDVSLGDRAAERFSAEVPGLEEAWEIGVIVGPSGSGKSTIARAAFGDHFYRAPHWPDDRAIIDCLGDAPIKSITLVLSSVGLSSPPSWLKPHAVLSNGEQFRCELARALLGGESVVVFDEFTSVVDRTVAKIASAALARSIRSHGAGRALRFVAVTCHYDVVEWIEPDWVVDMAGASLARGRLRRPRIQLQIERTNRSIWPVFKRHHYLSGELHRGAQCYLASIEGRPAAFTAVLAHPHPIRPGWREHRTVCHPDFQGVGVGNALSEYVASLYVAGGKPYFSTTGHPGMIAHRTRSPLWRTVRRPGCIVQGGHAGRVLGLGRRNANPRITAGFEFVGPARLAEALAFRSGSVAMRRAQLHDPA